MCFESKEINFKTIQSDSIKVLYTGRATPEKRVELAAAIALKSARRGLPVKFTFVGDIKESLPDELRTAGSFPGMETSPEKMHGYYRDSDVVIITSTEEGFPMSVMEGMAFGNAILSTPVGDIPNRVVQDKHGFIFSSVSDKELIINEALDFLVKYSDNLQYRKDIVEATHKFALQEFSLERFRSDWIQLVKHLTNSD